MIASMMIHISGYADLYFGLFVLSALLNVLTLAVPSACTLAARACESSAELIYNGLMRI
jgi:hypothetical protein